jgi:small subunit ribosomal protein S20e
MGQVLTTFPSLNAPTEVVKQIIINIEAGVEVEVTIAA